MLGTAEDRKETQKTKDPRFQKDMGFALTFPKNYTY